MNAAAAKVFGGIGGTMSRNTEATEEVGIWTGGRLNYKEGFFTQTTH
ncbi:Iron-sulfur cluster assembly protein SufB [Salmonella enterica subsp. enterica]|uniref:Iron-sulfur cluster assembly protein SufB n=1 Tax=Salmonella enterica I TaxID=59201 RepID=A0A447U4B5_SALET|nr:Iron-sulfur cluster assembly protein SufB [Salmonella enterica subsp. enterica]